MVKWFRIVVAYQIISLKVPQVSAFQSLTDDLSVYSFYCSSIILYYHVIVECQLILNICRVWYDFCVIICFLWLTLTTKNICMFLCAQGETVLKELAKLSGQLSVRIAVNTPQESQPQDDLRLLNDSGVSVFFFIPTIWCSVYVLNVFYIFHPCFLPSLYYDEGFLNLQYLKLLMQWKSLVIVLSEWRFLCTGGM